MKWKENERHTLYTKIMHSQYKIQRLQYMLQKSLHFLSKAFEYHDDIYINNQENEQPVENQF